RSANPREHASSRRRTGNRGRDRRSYFEAFVRKVSSGRLQASRRRSQSAVARWDTDVSWKDGELRATARVLRQRANAILWRGRTRIRPLRGESTLGMEALTDSLCYATERPSFDEIIRIHALCHSR